MDKDKEINFLIGLGIIEPSQINKIKNSNPGSGDEQVYFWAKALMVEGAVDAIKNRWLKTSDFLTVYEKQLIPVSVETAQLLVKAANNRSIQHAIKESALTIPQLFRDQDKSIHSKELLKALIKLVSSKKILQLIKDKVIQPADLIISGRNPKALSLELAVRLARLLEQNEPIKLALKDRKIALTQLTCKGKFNQLRLKTKQEIISLGIRFEHSSGTKSDFEPKNLQPRK